MANKWVSDPKSVALWLQPRTVDDIISLITRGTPLVFHGLGGWTLWKLVNILEVRQRNN